MHFRFGARDGEGRFCTGSWEQVGQQWSMDWACAGRNPNPRCDALRPEDCVDSGVAHWRRDDRPASVVDLELACMGGSVEGCRLASDFKAIGRRAAIIGCGRGSHDACYKAGLHVDDPTLAHTFHERACRLGSPHACVHLAREAHRDEDAAGVRAWSAQACALGVTEACPTPKG